MSTWKSHVYWKQPKAPENGLTPRKNSDIATEFTAGICYCGASAGMILFNKVALSSFNFDAPNTLLFFQCLLSVFLVYFFKCSGIIQIKPMRMDVVKIWFPVNLIFVGMLATSFYSLKNLGVATVTVLKNLTNLLVIFGDLIFFGKKYSVGVWVSLGLIAASALCSGVTDLGFNFEGYAWQLINCCFAAGYSLRLRSVMNSVQEITQNRKGLDELSMVLYNNILSLPLLLLLMFAFGEIPGFLYEQDLLNPYFQMAAFTSGILGFFISFASLWFLSTSTPTTYSLVGSLNKIPVSIIGIIAFNTHTSIPNLIKICRVGAIATTQMGAVQVVLNT
eukprot:TRINITY_DN4817_c0_g1_i4.p1 TRINITY_DN4817_c0_g1~~TRINITY_DN4817_c0_g1_i4.p1  ORF type:complete len:334 (+),score=32.80 TRINITY_DN4817_c0_g1_i4:102-1103(+)